MPGQVQMQEVSVDGPEFHNPNVESSSSGMDKAQLTRLDSPSSLPSLDRTGTEPQSARLVNSNVRVRGVSVEMRNTDYIDDDETDSVGTADTQLDATQKQLEDLQIRTIYTLVEDLEVELSGVVQKKKLLYVTNKQARMFLSGEEDNIMEKFLPAFDVMPRPKLVINLFASYATFSDFNPFKVHWRVNMQKGTGYGDHNMHGEPSDEDVRITDRKILMFLQECVLPVAKDTNALVLTYDNACSLANAWGMICEQEASKGPLPFTVMTFQWATWAPTHPDTVSGQLREKSKRWKAAVPKVDEAVINTHGRFRSNHSHGPFYAGDVPAGATHIIIVEGVSKKKDDPSALHSFRNQFVSKLSKALPSIAMTTLAMSMEYYDTNKTRVISDYVNRGLPLMFIDTRPIAPVCANAQTVKEMTSWFDQLNAELQSKGHSNSYWASTLAVWQGFLKRKRMSALNERKDGLERRGERKWLLWQELESKELIDTMQEKREQKRRKSQHPSATNTLEAVDEEQDLTMAAIQSMSKINLSNIRFHIDRDQSKLAKLADAIQDCKTHDEVSQLIQSVSMSWCMELWPGIWKTRADHLRHCPSRLFGVTEVKQGDVPWMEAMILNSTSTDTDLAEVKEVLCGHVATWQKFDYANATRGYDVHNPRSSTCDGQFDSEVYAAMYNILMSKSVFSANVEQHEDISKQINRIAKIDRLPSSNTVMALRVIRECWDCVDIYTARAQQMKRITKTAYILMLLLGYAMTVLTTIYLNGLTEPDSSVYITKRALRLCVIILSLVGSCLAAFVTYANPAQQWQNLRGAALAIETEVWKFRTRTGPYALTTDANRSNPRAGEEFLGEFCTSVGDHVLKSAAVAETSFGASFLMYVRNGGKSGNPKKFHHGQRKHAGTRGTYGSSNMSSGRIDDDHQSPLNPDDYLRLRVEPALQFYRSRLPTYHRERTVSEIFAVATGLSGTLLAYLDVAHWIPVLAAAAAMVTAYMEFESTSKKMVRYNDTIVRCRGVINWWDRLTEVDRASLHNIGTLVQSCEESFARERQAWQSTSMVTKMLSQEFSERGSNGEGGDDQAAHGS